MVWTATVVANTGGWMYSAAAAWLMTELTTDPLLVSLVQVATSLPMFLFALTAGAMTDIVDKRRYLIGVEIAILVVAAIFAMLVTLDLVTAPLLLAFMFVVAAGSAFDAPAWQAIVPMLVPREDLQGAVAVNSVGVNISRAIGPALSGVVTAALGLAAPFWLDAFSNLATIGALAWWRPSSPRARRLPAERLASAMRVGVRYARNNPPLRATLVRAVAFFLFASAYWALLPLLARAQIAGGAEVYGVLLGAIGAGAVGAAFALPRLNARLGADRLARAATIGTAIALVLFAIARNAPTALIASVVAGACWIAAISTFNVSAQLALPDWVRGRGLAIYVTVFFGALTVGSVVWGEIAAHLGLPLAHLLAAAGALAGIPLTRGAHLQAAARLDLTPSMHWPTPVVAEDLAPDAGPVLVMLAYDVRPGNRNAFVEAMRAVEDERRRDGAYAWGLYEDAARPDRLVETFLVESWLEHLRQHERVTKADELVQECAQRWLVGPPVATHFVDAEALDGDTSDPNAGAKVERSRPIVASSTRQESVMPASPSTKSASDVLAGLGTLLPDLEALYKDVHAHPELSMQETRTAGIAAERLRKAGYDVTTGIGKTGVVGVLRNGEGPTLMLRADMDALPVAEETGLPYASSATATNAEGKTVPVGHMCGHDMHVAWLAGAATLLAQSRDGWKGTLMVVFQPGEEIAQGARAMLDDGLLQRFPKPEVVLGQHVMVGPSGTVAGSAGPITSAADSLQIRLFGRGAHGSMPQASIDPVVMAAATVLRLQTIVSREVAATQAAVVTVGVLQAGEKENVIPDDALIKLNVRTFDAGVRRHVLDAITRIVNAEAAASGALRMPEITPIDSYPLNVNDKAASERVAQAFRAYFSPERVKHTGPAPASEDFGCFATAWQIPSVYWFVGGDDPEVYAKAKAEGKVNDLPVNHSPHFAPVLHPTLETGVEALVVGALAWLASP